MAYSGEHPHTTP